MSRKCKSCTHELFTNFDEDTQSYYCLQHHPKRREIVAAKRKIEDEWLDMNDGDSTAKKILSDFWMSINEEPQSCHYAKLSLDEIGVKYAQDDFGKGKKNYTGGDKTSLGQNFTEKYEELFEDLRHNKLNLLELGILCGKSLAMWSDYFQNGKIFGVDISLENYNDYKKNLRKLGAFRIDNVNVYEQDILKPEFGNLLNELPNFDIIIDDANHKSTIQYQNFELLFAKLKPEGIYIIEDIIEPLNFMELFKDIYAGTANCNDSLLKKNKNYKIMTQIKSIEMTKNMVIIKKKSF